MLQPPLMSGGELTDHRQTLGSMCNVFIVTGKYETTLKSLKLHHFLQTLPKHLQQDQLRWLSPTTVRS